MAFSPIGTSNVKNSASENICGLTPHASTAIGDIMFAHITTNTGYASGEAAGWTKIAQNDFSGGYSQLYYKIAGNSESSTEAKWTYSSGRRMWGYIITFRDGFNTTNPIDAVSNTQYSTSNTSIIAASMSVANTNSPLLFFGSVFKTDGSVSYTKPSVPTTDWVEYFDSGSSTSDMWTNVCYMTWSSSGATGNMTGTLSTNVSLKHAFAVALNTPVSGPANLKSYNTNLKANIKSINTNLIANLKSLDTNV